MPNWSEYNVWERGEGLWRGLRRRIAATFALVAGGFAALVLYAAFLASRFAWYENLAVILSALVLIPASIVVMWLLWGLSLHRRFAPDEPIGPFDPFDPW